MLLVVYRKVKCKPWCKLEGFTVLHRKPFKNGLNIGMSVNYQVFYRGRADDQQVFVDRYRNEHVPILKRFPGILGVSLLTPLGWQDKHPVNSGQFMLIVQMKFATIEALENALQSEARDEAREDFKKFSAFGGEIWHQAMKLEDQFE
jgi:uncharacterized protein (TIGR02118 family)